MRRIFLNILCVMALGAMAAQAQVYTIEQCREMALQHNEDLRKAGISVERAELDKQIAFSNYLPTLDGSFSALAMKEIDLSGTKLLLQGTYLAGITLMQPIFVGGKIYNGNKLAKVGKQVAEEQLRQQRQQCIADVDKAYYTLVSVEAKVKMLETLHAQLDTIMRQVKASVSAEMATNADALRVQAKQSEVAYNLEKARNGESLCRMVLCSEIGIDLDTPIEVEEPAQPSGDDALSADFSQRPELAMLNHAIEAKRLQVKMATAEMLPTVALSLGYTYYGNIKLKGVAMGPDGNYYPYEQSMKDGLPMAFLTVQVPIFHWGSHKKIKQARLDVESARYDLEKNQRLMSIEVQQAIKNVEDARRMISTATLGQQQADENLRIMRLRHDAKLSTLTDLLDAESQGQQAHANLIEAETQYRICHTEYLRVTGQL